MRTVFISLLLGCCITLCAQSEKIVPGEILVQIAPGASLPDIRANLEISLNGGRLAYGRCLSQRMGLHLLRYDPSLDAADQVLRRLQRQAGVLAVQHNHYVSPRSNQTTFPDDPIFSQQWGLHNTGQTGGIVDADIDAVEAWDRNTGSISPLGDTLVVAVIDDGFDLFHEDLTYWRNHAEIPNNGLDDDGNGYVDDYHGWNAYNSSGAIPQTTHGTEVAGIIGANGDNERGVTGVNWGIQIMPIAGASGTEMWC